ncbi:MAG TPA: AAA family ATPase [Vicinamibacteria bacterium]|nr:AAA family ATPase [Vicinamibacteria bacterium]
MYERVLDLRKLVSHRSLFLFGPRLTGKSTLVRHAFPDAIYVDLLEADTFRELSARPEYMRQTLPPSARIVIVDEVQKLPLLLDEVHLLIERNDRLRFVLTGSSARKLKRGGANLLAGRARIQRLHPLVAAEAPSSRLLDRINRGGLPAILDSDEYREDLRAYVGTYLQEEIQAEGLSRSIGNFSRFLEVAGLSNGEQVNFTSVASDVGLSPNTVREYYRILEDTLIGHLLPPYQGTTKRKPVATAKFYLFDVGVANSLRRTGFIERGSDAYGRALEHLVFLELRSYLDYARSDELLTYWRSRSQLEVDFLVHDRVAIEVKAKSRVSPRDYKGVLALGEELDLDRRIVVCDEARRRSDDVGVEIFPVAEFLRDLWAGKIVGAERSRRRLTGSRKRK